MRSEAWSEMGDLNGEMVHAIAAGTTGCGKTQTFVLPMLYRCIEMGESAVVIDAKDGEIFSNLSAYAENHRQIIYNLSTPGSSPETWNPIQEGHALFHSSQAEDRDRAMEMTVDLASAIYSTEGTSDVYWPLSASNLFTGVVAALYEVAPSQDYINLSSVSNMLNNLDKRDAMSTLGKELAGILKPNSPAKQYLQAYCCGASDTRASTLTTATQHLYNTCGKSEGLMRFLSTSSVRFSVLDYEKPTIVWIILSQQSSASYNALAGLLVNHIINELLRTSQRNMDQRLPLRWNIFIDEAGVTKVPSLPMLAACGRSRNIRLLLALQDPNTQLSTLYGTENASSILSNISSRFVFMNSSLPTLEYYSRLCGSMWDESTGSWQPLVSASELMSLPPGRCLLLHTGGFKAIADLPFFYRTLPKRWSILPAVTRQEEPPKVFDLEKFIFNHKHNPEKSKPMAQTNFQPHRMDLLEDDDTPQMPDSLKDFEHIGTPKDIQKMLEEIDIELEKISKLEEEQKKRGTMRYRLTIVANHDNAKQIAFTLASGARSIELDLITITKVLQVLHQVEFLFSDREEAERIANMVRSVGGTARISEGV